MFAEYRNKQAEAVYSAQEIVKIDSIPSDAQRQDTDKDGIPDWEEILVGTDPKDAKSKDVTKSGSTVTKDLTQSKEKLEQIDIVSRDFFARYMELRQAGISKDKASQQELITKTAGNIVLPQIKLLKTTDIITKIDSSKEAVKQYGNDIGLIFKKYSISARNEAIIAKEALDKENPKILDELDPIIASYKNTLNALLKVTTPQTMLQIHLDLVNGVNGLIFTSELFKKSSIDPVSGLQAAGNYMRMAENFNSAFNAIRSYFTYLGITYTTQEAGIIFNSTQ